MMLWEMIFGTPHDHEFLPFSLFEDTRHDLPFRPQEATDLRVIGDACAATRPVLPVTMLWDLPGIRLAVGEEESMPTPVLYPVPVSGEITAPTPPSHRDARVDRIRGAYHENIDFKLTLTDAEINAKSYMVFARGRSGWPEGHDIDEIAFEKGIAD